MAQRKTQHRRPSGSYQNLPVHGARAAAEMRQWAVYSTSPRFPGKLIQRLPDGTEMIGTFQDGAFVADQAGEA
jgi:hypothetical protein